MKVIGARKSDRNRTRLRPIRTPRTLSPAVEGCERRMLLSGIVGNHIGVAAEVAHGPAIKH